MAPLTPHKPGVLGGDPGPQRRPRFAFTSSHLFPTSLAFRFSLLHPPHHPPSTSCLPGSRTPRNSKHKTSHLALGFLYIYMCVFIYIYLYIDFFKKRKTTLERCMTKGFTHLPALPMLGLPLSPQPCSLRSLHTMQVPTSSQPTLEIPLQPTSSIN